MLFKGPDDGSLSPGRRFAPAVLLVAAVINLVLALGAFVLWGTPLPFSVLWAPMNVFSAWLIACEHDEWPESTLPVFRNIGLAGLVLCAMSVVYGAWDWGWRGGDPAFALHALVLLIAGLWRLRRALARRDRALVPAP